MAGSEEDPNYVRSDSGISYLWYDTTMLAVWYVPPGTLLIYLLRIRMRDRCQEECTMNFFFCLCCCHFLFSCWDFFPHTYIHTHHADFHYTYTYRSLQIDFFFLRSHTYMHDSHVDVAVIDRDEFLVHIFHSTTYTTPYTCTVYRHKYTSTRRSVLFAGVFRLILSHPGVYNLFFINYITYIPSILYY